MFDFFERHRRCSRLGDILTFDSQSWLLFQYAFVGYITRKTHMNCTSIRFGEQIMVFVWKVPNFLRLVNLPTKTMQQYIHTGALETKRTIWSELPTFHHIHPVSTSENLPSYFIQVLSNTRILGRIRVQ